MCCADSLCYFSLCDTCGSTSFEKFVKESELFIQLIIFCFYICPFKGTGFKFFVSEHFCTPSFFVVPSQALSAVFYQIFS